MDGKIYFDDVADLARFLKEFTGSTAVFTVTCRDGQYVLVFTGGY